MQNVFLSLELSSLVMMFCRGFHSVSTEQPQPLNLFLQAFEYETIATIIVINLSMLFPDSAAATFHSICPSAIFIISFARFLFHFGITE